MFPKEEPNTTPQNQLTLIGALRILRGVASDRFEEAADDDTVSVEWKYGVDVIARGMFYPNNEYMSWVEFVRTNLFYPTTFRGKEALYLRNCGTLQYARRSPIEDLTYESVR